jgi:hypothetical protein
LMRPLPLVRTCWQQVLNCARRGSACEPEERQRPGEVAHGLLGDAATEKSGAKCVCGRRAADGAGSSSGWSDGRVMSVGKDAARAARQARRCSARAAAGGGATLGRRGSSSRAPTSTRLQRTAAVSAARHTHTQLTDDLIAIKTSYSSNTAQCLPATGPADARRKRERERVEGTGI